MRQLNTFNDLKSTLTEQDIDEIVTIIGARCQQQTKRKLRINLECSTSFIPAHGILERLTKDDKIGWTYCAGQSYPDEIRTVREIIRDLK